MSENGAEFENVQTDRRTSTSRMYGKAALVEEFIAAKTNTAEAADSKLRKCKWLFVNGSDCKSPICAATHAGVRHA